MFITIVICVIFFILTNTIDGAKPKVTAAVPKSKKAKKSIFMSSIFNKIIREAKIAFCSDLEALTLLVKIPINR